MCNITSWSRGSRDNCQRAVAGEFSYTAGFNTASEESSEGHMKEVHEYTSNRASRCNRGSRILKERDISFDVRL